LGDLSSDATHQVGVVEKPFGGLRRRGVLGNARGEVLLRLLERAVQDITEGPQRGTRRPFDREVRPSQRARVRFPAVYLRRFVLFRNLDRGGQASSGG
jgi:hypothetical protein